MTSLLHGPETDKLTKLFDAIADAMEGMGGQPATILGQTILLFAVTLAYQRRGNGDGDAEQNVARAFRAAAHYLETDGE